MVDFFADRIAFRIFKAFDDFFKVQQVVVCFVAAAAFARGLNFDTNDISNFHFRVDVFATSIARVVNHKIYLIAKTLVSRVVRWGLTYERLNHIHEGFFDARKNFKKMCHKSGDEVFEKMILEWRFFCLTFGIEREGITQANLCKEILT